MKTKLLAVVLAAVGTLSAGITTVTFDGLGLTPGNETTGTALAAQIAGLTFAASAGSAVFATDALTYAAVPLSDGSHAFVGTYLGFLEGVGAGGVGGMLTVTFTGNAHLNSLSFLLNDTEASPQGSGVMAQVYDGVTLLDTFDSSGGLDTVWKDYSGFGAGIYVTHIKFTNVGADGFLLEDISFTEAPEPATFGMVSAALIGLGVLRRRQRS